MARGASEVLAEDEIDAGVPCRRDAAANAKQVVDPVLDADLIGGLVAHVGDKVYDASVRARLDAMQRSLIAGGGGAEAAEA